MVFYPKIIFVLLINISYANEILLNTKLVTDLRIFFTIKWVIVYTCDKKIANPSFFKFLKEIKKEEDFFVTLYDTEDFFRFTNISQLIFHKAIILLPCWKCNQHCLVQLDKLHKIQIFSRFIWISEFENDVRDNKQFHLPYNSMFGVLRKKDLFTWDLFEIYQLDSSWHENKLGTWSKLKGLEMTRFSMYERKSDFFGLNVTAYFKAPDPGLEIKMPYFYLDLFSDIAKRLNITAHIIDDIDGDYEVSVALQEMKIPANYEYLQTLHTSWLVLFFLDIKTELLLDSFIQPFHLDVWVTILVWIFATSLILHQISKALKTWIRPKIAPKKFHEYFFERLVVVFQKYEDPKENFLSQRIIQIFYWIASINIYAFYSAIFIAFVTVIIRKPPFSTLEEVLNNGKYNVVLGHKEVIRIFGDNPHENIRKLFLYHSDAKHITNNLHKAVEMICSEKEKLAVMHSFNRYQKAKVDFPNCAISDTYVKLQFMSFSWLIKRDSPYKKIFQNCLSEMIQGGNVISLYNKRTVMKKEKDLTNFYEIKTSQLLFLYIILTGGVLLSILILIIEIHF